ncbi:hypothetical protein EVAR_10571_1 [Eumeta japonica]|uniref:Uncharacterized protein n=1 Tax=Eumeta variegata TaxID=151549 RepID=A0A4C1U223_EUMVA|nr:hypothetical protein EVAR_10571_1 [Eumeta japonica]
MVRGRGCKADEPVSLHLTSPDSCLSGSMWFFVSFYHGPHSANIIFDRRHRRTSLTLIISQSDATTFELVKPIINSGEGWSFIMKG